MTESKEDKICTELEAVVTSCNLTALEALGAIRKGFRMAEGVARMKKLIDQDVMRSILPLQGTSLGFRTDKDKEGGYDQTVVRDCFIEASLRGLHPVGNEWNIISGRCYVTKEGFTRLLRELPGLTDLRLTMDVPKMVADKGAIVKATATWKLNGHSDKLEREIPVRTNAGMGADAILGKAERKLRAAIYSQITGTTMSDGEAGDDGAIDITPKRDAAKDLNEKLKEQANGETEQ